MAVNALLEGTGVLRIVNEVPVILAPLFQKTVALAVFPVVLEMFKVFILITVDEFAALFRMLVAEVVVKFAATVFP